MKTWGHGNTSSRSPKSKRKANAPRANQGTTPHNPRVTAALSTSSKLAKPTDSGNCSTLGLHEHVIAERRGPKAPLKRKGARRQEMHGDSGSNAPQGSPCTLM
eukprot:CAMPEP_0174302892 /NCGR_PEP_ID=MMETSP0809-20121228/59875_1 /TAXON_ID=73025 ORGANISM="Eutreptiella gymnastica-like, Strain CCMP1594" /NCGR_SAMPLE_ID=MMETSP0809 /ASSEMBLY_ACC=CAM_ASM_000658 /LENGTH=102 /DNA_ID=CAMNT_0015408837 /DNA_START=77 /DNA_END=386 /DNA_ORIENTATION=-